MADGHVIDLDALYSMTEPQVWSRGVAYAEQGRVRIRTQSRARVTGRVDGTESYDVLVYSDADGTDGSCTCPAFDSFGVCKHMVALALAAENREEALEDSIEAYLSGLDHQVLVDLVMAAARDDDALWQKLDMAAAAASEDDAVLRQRLRGGLDEALDFPGFLDRRYVPEVAEDLARLLATIESLCSSRPALALEVVEEVIEVLEPALESMDDSGGLVMAQFQRAASIHLRACAAVRPDPEQLAVRLVARECADLWGIFGNLDARYADVLGEAGRKAFRQRVEEAWATATASPDGTTGDPPVDKGILLPMIDRFLEQDGDLDGRIALRTRDLHSVDDYLELIRLCRTHDRPDQAARWADEALFLFEDDRCDDLHRAAASAFAAAGRTDRAIAALWPVFERRPSVDDYRVLRGLGDEALVDRAIGVLRDRAGTAPAGGWGHPADPLIAVLIDEERFDAAWDAQRTFGAGPTTAERLARATEKSHTADAIRVYTDAIDAAVKSGSQQGYRHAADLLDRLASMRSANQQALHIHHLRKVFKRKRNFIALLPDV